MRAAFALGTDTNLTNFVRLMQDRGHKGAGALRASMGLVSNFPDAWRLMQFVGTFQDQTRLATGDVTFDIDSCRVIRDGS
jgi:hypothetical protein